MDPTTTTPFKTPDALEEKAGTLEDIVRAILNMLEDFHLEKTQLEETQRALFNIIDDFSAEKARHEEIQRATMNILEDFKTEKVALEDTFRATLNVLEDLEAEKAKVEAVNNALDREIAESKQAEERIKKLNEELEGQTAQLAAANKELEAFSYSVSHDLRAPLRAMDGFSRILLEEHASQLPAKAQRYLGLVRGNTQQMGHLIEDLLAFSRLSRLPLNKQTVAPADLVRQALAELSAEQEGRQIEISIGDPSAGSGQVLPACEADPALLKQVWANLLSNALKFTRKRDVARIEVSSLDISDRRLQISDLAEPLKSEIFNLKSAIYFVRDNGVGFDMRYANKLFGVFQRLHRAEEYEGTGVGLAIVQRIVHRHGGRVWAEAEVDKGATFYFTI